VARVGRNPSKRFWGGVTGGSVGAWKKKKKQILYNRKKIAASRKIKTRDKTMQPAGTFRNSDAMLPFGKKKNRTYFREKKKRFEARTLKS